MVTSESKVTISLLESVMLIKVYVKSPTSDVGAGIDMDGELSHIMEAESLNALSNLIDDLQERVGELRRYL